MEPDIPITINPDGTPVYDEDEEPSATPTTTYVSTSSSQPSSSALSSSTISSRTLCGPSCSACANNDPSSLETSAKIKRHRKGDTASLKKRVFDEPSNDPWNGNMIRFIADQIGWHSIRFVPHADPETHPSSSRFHPLGNFPFTFGVDGLYGCSSLIIHSTKGVWISHFFEEPSFFNLDLIDVRDPEARRLQQQAMFKEQVIDLLGPGDRSGLFDGLNQFIGADGKTGGPFSEDTLVMAVIITPEDEKGDRVYEDMAEQIASEVTRLFGGDRGAGDRGRLASDVEFINYIPEDPSVAGGTRGIALFQYEPLQARCVNPNTGGLAQLAERRLWFGTENRGPLEKEYWPALPEQVLPVTSQQPGSKRRNVAANEMEHELDRIRPGRRRRRDWTPGGVQPSLYPSCLAALENTGTGPVPTAAVPVGPDGPLSGAPTSPNSIIATTTTTTSSATEVTRSATCVQNKFFETLDGCEADCLNGVCMESSRDRMKERCPGCGSWGPTLEANRWLCSCFL